MVFEQEAVSHGQESDSGMREFKADYSRVCRLRSQARFRDVEKEHRSSCREAYKNQSGQGLSRYRQTSPKQRNPEEKDEKLSAEQTR